MPPKTGNPPLAASATPEASRRKTVWILLAQAVVIALIAWPIVRIRNLPLTDYPNHLARAFIEQQLDLSPALQTYYHIVPGFYPYYAMNVAVRSLAWFIDIENAGHLFAVLTLVMPMLGTLILFRTVWGRWSMWPAVAGIFAYGGTIAHGYLPFTFALGAAMIAFAGWIATERWPASKRWLAFAVVAAAILALHLFAFGIFGLLVGSWELGQSRLAEWRWAERAQWTRPVLRRNLLELLKRQGIVALVFGPSALLILLMQHGPMGQSANLWGLDISHRAVAVLDPVLFVSDWLIDTPQRQWEIGLLLGFLLLRFAGFATGTLSFDRRFTLPIAIIGLAMLLEPVTLWNITELASRLSLPFFSLLIVSAAPCGQNRVARGVGALAIGVLLIVRIATVAPPLTAADQGIAELRQMAEAIPRGARVLPMSVVPRVASGLPWTHFWHSTAYLVLDRQIFYPLLSTIFDVRINERYIENSTPQSVPLPTRLLEMQSDPELIPGERNYWQKWQTAFDYVVVEDFGAPESLESPRLTLIGKGNIFSVYKINPS